MSLTNVENVYNEVTHTNMSPYGVNGMDPMYHWDTHFPERLSINTEYPSPVARRSRKGRPRNAARFKTQPITFDEIKEVDEEPNTADDASKNKEGLKSHFTAFSRSMDGLVPTFQQLKRSPELFIRPLSSDYNENQIHCKPPIKPATQPSRLSPDGGVELERSNTPSPELTELEVKEKTPEKLAIPTPMLSDSSRNRRQKRFKKKQRHSRSIEEESGDVSGDRLEAQQAVR